MCIVNDDDGEIVMTLARLEKKLMEAYKNERHLTDAANGVYMAALRNNVDLSTLLNDIENGTAFRVSEFFTATTGNLLDYLKSDYHTISQSLIDVVAGGNGGMASIGRGEFFVAFLSNFSATISKSGNGDIYYNGKWEEMKYNNGKINVAAKPGREVFGQLTYNEWAIKCVKQAAEETFKKSDTLLIIDKNNNFVRFTNPKEVVEHYKDRVEVLKFELRNKQSNPVAIYMEAA